MAAEVTLETRIALRTRPLMPDFGVEIMDVDVTSAEPDVLGEIVAAFHRHGAIMLRGQYLDQPAQLAFTRLFGEPERNARPEWCDPDYPHVYVISNKVVNGRAIGDPHAGLGWHTDFSYAKRTALCTVLHSWEVPKEGSDTLLADLCAAWNALPEQRQRQLDGLSVHHSFAKLMARRNQTLSPEQERDFPDVWHPLVRTHPADGRKALWVSTGQVKGIVGMDEAEALALMEELVEFGTEERFVYRHKWQVGDILVWDNRCTLHRGTMFDMVNDVRHVHRTWVVGDVPF